MREGKVRVKPREACRMLITVRNIARHVDTVHGVCSPGGGSRS